MKYSKQTQELIDRQCRNVERADFVLDKKLSEELIMRTYDLFNLPRPKKVIWCKDLKDKEFDSSARSAWSALDYDFDWFTFAFEYKIKNEKEVNENDIKYLEYCELLMQAKEAGLGYRVEWEDTLYLVPTPIVKINELNQFHSDQLPAISWKGGQEIYYLDGVLLEKKVWQKILSQKMTFSEIMAIEISDQRTVALKYNPLAIINENAKLVHKDDRNNELYMIENQKINTELNFPKIWFLKMLCPTGRVFVEGVPPDEAEKNPNASVMQALLCNLTLEEYLGMKLES